jgi:cytochrome c-type biogenesis protein CcmH
MERLRGVVAGRPDDLTGQELLSRNEAALGNFTAAAAAQARVVALKGAAATAADYLALADAQIMAADGYVSPEAEQALALALKRDPKNPTAQFYMGLMFAQTLRPDLAFELWRPLSERGPQAAPWMPLVRDQIAGIAAAAGIDYTPPAADDAGVLPGPDAGSVAAAGEMSAGDRQAMVREMVGRLNERLATQGGTAEEWARLIGALGVLGDTDRARAIHAEARQTFARQPEALAILDAAARQAGFGQ